MYKIENYQIPENKKFSEYTLELVREIRSGKNVEENKDKLFRLCYPLMRKEINRYTDLRPADELVSDLSVAFMQTIKSIDTDKKEGSFIGYLKTVFRREVIKNYYGGYTAYHKDLQKQYKEFHRQIGSIEGLNAFVSSRTHNSDTLDIHETFKDEKINIEKDYEEVAFIEDVYKAIDKVFTTTTHGRSLKNTKPRTIFTLYIENILFDKGMKNVDIARIAETSKQYINEVVGRYLNKFQTRMQEMGYDNF